MNAVKKFADQGVAVVMVLHDINLAARYCDKLLALLCSQSVAYGSINDVVTEKNVEHLFGVKVQIIPHPLHGTPITVDI